MSLTPEMKEFLDSLKTATEKFQSQEGIITGLEEKVSEMSGTILKMASEGRGPDHQGFSTEHEAKHFCDFIRGVFQGASAKDLVDTMNVTNADDGGVTVPLEFRPTLIMMLEQFGLARQLCTVIPMNRMELEFPKLTNGIQTYWIGEGQTIPKTKPQFGSIKLTAKKLATLIPITSELLEDSTIEIANLLATLIANAIAAEEDRCTFSGKAANAPWDSILWNSDVPSLSLAAGNTAFSAINADDMADAIAGLTPAQSTGARWIMHRTVFNIVRKLKNETGDYIYTPPNSPTEPGTIWGYPYTLSEVMPSIANSAADTPYIILGNPKHAYFGDRKAMSVARSEHLGFAEDKIFIRVVQRDGFAIALPEALRTIRTAAV